jgi:CBS domain-containing protein
VLVRELMTSVPAAGPDWPVRRAAALLLEHGLPAVPVVDGTGRLVGMVSEVDLIRDDIEADPRAQQRLLSDTEAALPRTVDEVMTPDVLALTAGADVSTAVTLMVQAGVRSLPVVEGDRVIGIIERRDVLRLLVVDSDAIRLEVSRRIAQATGNLVGVIVQDGVVTLETADGDRSAEIASLVARTVPGVLRVRVSPAQAAPGP